MAFCITRVLLKDFEKGGFKPKNFRKDGEGFNSKRPFKKRDQGDEKPFGRKKFQRDEEGLKEDRGFKKRDGEFTKRSFDRPARSGYKPRTDGPPGSFKWNDKSADRQNNYRGKPRTEGAPNDKYKKYVKSTREQVFEIAKKEISAPLSEPAPEREQNEPEFEHATSNKRLNPDQMKQITDMRAVIHTFSFSYCFRLSPFPFEL